MDDEEETQVKNKTSEAAPPRRRPKKIIIPRRAPSIVIPERVPFYPSPDKTTCAKCPCFPKEEPYQKRKKLNPCQHCPLSLSELASEVVDRLAFPEAFTWSVEDVALWFEEELGLPQYRECILDNHIDGMRLLMLEDPSKPPMINIHEFQHILRISSAVRKEYGMDFIKFSRSVGLPPRTPLPSCVWFKSRTGPSWGIRKNWSRVDILRWMKVIVPAPVYRDHWDMVWYTKPDFPREKVARVAKPPSHVQIPHYRKPRERCTEYQVPRKFKFQTGIPDEEQLIWMERRPEIPRKEVQEKKKKKKEKKAVIFIISKDSRLYPKKVTSEGLKGKDLVLARRKMPKPKFLA